MNELELLGVVWSTEYFENYLYGKHFSVIRDQRALLSILNQNQSNKSYKKRLVLLIGRLIPFQFDIEHLPGAKMGLVDYISRHPNQKAKKLFAYDDDLFVAKLKLISTSVNSLKLEPTKSAVQCNKFLQHLILQSKSHLKLRLQLTQ